MMPTVVFLYISGQLLPRLHFSLRGIDTVSEKQKISNSNKDDEDQTFGSAVWTASYHLCSTKYTTLAQLCMHYMALNANCPQVLILNQRVHPGGGRTKQRIQGGSTKEPSRK